MEDSLSILVETQLTLYVSSILAAISCLNLKDFYDYCAPAIRQYSESGAELYYLCRRYKFVRIYEYHKTIRMFYKGFENSYKV